MNRRRVWVVTGVVTVLAIGAAAGLFGLRAARAAQAEGGKAALPAGGLADRPLAKLFRENLGRFRALRGELGLTDEQRNEIKAILKSHKEEIRTVAGELREEHKKLREATLRQPLDEAAIRQAASDMATSIGDAAVLHAKVREEVVSKLTPQQVRKLDTFRKDVETSVDKCLASAGKQ
jgi:Spy/CpxP family protein refolding chaperone